MNKLFNKLLVDTLRSHSVTDDNLHMHIWAIIGFGIAIMTATFEVSSSSFVVRISTPAIQSYLAQSGFQAPVVYVFWFYALTMPFVILYDVLKPRSIDSTDKLILPWSFFLTLTMLIYIFAIDVVSLSNTGQGKTLHRMLVTHWLLNYLVYTAMALYMSFITSAFIRRYIHNKSLQPTAKGGD